MLLANGTRQPFRVSGLFVPPGADLGQQTQVAFAPATAQRLLLDPGTWTAAAVTLAPGADPGTVKAAVASSLGKGYTVKTRAEQVQEAKDTAGTFVNIFTYVLLGFAVVALLVGGFLIFNTFSMVVAQRAREMALLRAVGARRKQVEPGAARRGRGRRSRRLRDRARPGPARRRRPRQAARRDRPRSDDHAVGAGVRGGVVPRARGGRHVARRRHPHPAGGPGLAGRRAARERRREGDQGPGPARDRPRAARRRRGPVLPGDPRGRRRREGAGRGGRRRSPPRRRRGRARACRGGRARPAAAQPRVAPRASWRGPTRSATRAGRPRPRPPSPSASPSSPASPSSRRP